MVRISELVPGRFLECLDVGDSLGDVRELTIDKVSVGEIDGEQKAFVHFKETSKPMVLNRTNAKTLASLLGGECDNWSKKKIRLVRSETSFGGKVVSCIRVKE